MKFKILFLFLALSMSSLAQKEYLNLAGFGKIPFTKNGQTYSASLGKLGKFSFSGTIRPLSLSTSVGLDDLKAIPGTKILNAIGVEDIELTVAKKGVEIAANIGNSFKEKIKKKVRNKKVLKPVIGAILHTLDIRDSQVALLFDTQGKLGGKIELNVYVFGQRLPIPKLSAKLSLDKIIDAVVNEIVKKGLEKIKDVAKVVGKAVVKSTKAAVGAGKAAVEFAGNYGSHATHTRGECNGKCVPRLARDKAKPLRLKSQRILGEFYADVIVSLKNIRGETVQQTQALRKQHILNDWNKLIAEIDRSWSKVKKDRTYVSYYTAQSGAEGGGRIYRKKVQAEREKFNAYRDLTWKRLLTENGFEWKNKDIYMIRSKQYGTYWDLRGKHLFAEKQSGSKVVLGAKDNIHGGRQGADRLMKVSQIKRGKDVVVSFQPQHAEYFCGFTADRAGAEMKLVNANRTVYFVKKRVSGEAGAYYLVNPKNGLLLTANGSRPISQEAFNEQDNQKWLFEWSNDPQVMAPLDNEFRYAIQNVGGKSHINVISERVKDARLDPFKVSQRAARKSVKVTACKMRAGHESPDMFFRLYRQTRGKEHYFVLKPMLGRNVLNVMDGNVYNGAPLELWKKTNEMKQQFRFIYAGKPMTFFIQDRNSGKFVELPNNRLREHGAPVQINKFTGAKNQQWKFDAHFQWVKPNTRESFYVKAVYCNNEYWDPDGNKCKNGDKIKNWAFQAHADRRFKVVSAHDQSWLYILSTLSGRAVEVSNSSNGTQIRLGNKTNSNNQKFSLEFTSPTTFRIRSKVGKYLDVKGDSENGNSWKDDGRKIQINKDYYVRDRHFQLIYASGSMKGRPYRFK